MKKIILSALTILLMVGCQQHEQDYKVIKESPDCCNGFAIIEYDSCEYIQKSSVGGFGYLAHKGNCRFCKERRQKELNYIIEQLKEK